MNKYKNKTLIQGTVWKAGTDLPNCAHSQFVDNQTPPFPPFSLVVIQGDYQVVFEGDLVQYDPVSGNPVAIIRAMDMAIHYVDHPQNK